MNKIQLKKTEKSKIDGFTTMSAKIRYLDHCGYSQGDISRYLTTPDKLVRFQWVNNVLKTPVKNPKES